MTFTQPLPDTAVTFGQPGGIQQVIADQIKKLIKDTANNAPRSRQVSIGPSEVGEECVRKLAYKIMAWPEQPADRDPWASVIGTAVHAWMAELFEKRDPQRERYRVESRVTVRDGYGTGSRLAGSSDLFDRATGRNYDWKIVGTSTLNKYRRQGHPGQKYRIQAHLYGLGMANSGEQVNEVCVVFLPRSHSLEDTWVWIEKYDPQIALDAMARLDAIRDLVLKTDPEKNPQHWALFPTADSCHFCPYRQAGSSDLSQGCPGHTKTS
ncbi:hypothetical protein ACI3K4_27815 [Streptomyces sp. CSMPJR101]|uniref:hypothetical protein n=1 Tax=Streptomyces sp. CSMPJR101 TaxID=1279378 RepID=UPI003852710A